jgi:uncharacterized membrane protein YjjB (DUF3815 family)
MIVNDLFYDAIFAAIAGIGFGSISKPPLKAFPSIAILAALGHMTRFSLMHYANLNIASASLIGALTIGFGSFIAGSKTQCPMTVLSIPALLPMVPGIYAYKIIFSLMAFLRYSDDSVQSIVYMHNIEANFLIAFTTTFNLGMGATLPHFIFREKALSLTRSRPKPTPGKTYKASNSLV